MEPTADRHAELLNAHVNQIVTQRRNGEAQLDGARRRLQELEEQKRERQRRCDLEERAVVDMTARVGVAQVALVRHKMEADVLHADCTASRTNAPKLMQAAMLEAAEAKNRDAAVDAVVRCLALVQRQWETTKSVKNAACGTIEAAVSDALATDVQLAADIDAALVELAALKATPTAAVFSATVASESADTVAHKLEHTAAEIAATEKAHVAEKQRAAAQLEGLEAEDAALAERYRALEQWLADAAVSFAEVNRATTEVYEALQTEVCTKCAAST
jgi:chromosome segregation ATPase